MYSIRTRERQAKAGPANKEANQLSEVYPFVPKELGNDVALELLERATDPILGKDVTGSQMKRYCNIMHLLS